MRLPICSYKAERKEQARKTPGGLDVRNGYSFRTIAKFFKVNVHSAFVWVKTFAEKNPSKPAPIDDSVVIELDEMWHFLRSKKDKFWFGKLIAEPQNSSSIGSAARETLKHSEKCTSD